MKKDNTKKKGEKDNTKKKGEKEEKDNTKDKEEKDNTKKKEKKDENIIRIISNIILNSTKKLGITQEILGLTYKCIHCIYIFVISLIFSFNTNVIHLCILLFIITLDGFVVIVLHGCPLTLLEQKYLNTNCCDERCNYLKKAKIMYKCEHEYEKTIELLINIWLLICGKCLLLIFLNTFHIKLQNYNNTYS